MFLDCLAQCFSAFWLTRFILYTLQVVMSSCGWLNDDIEILHSDKISKATDIVRNTKILAFLLHRKTHLNSIFWDIDGVT